MAPNESGSVSLTVESQRPKTEALHYLTTLLEDFPDKRAAPISEELPEKNTFIDYPPVPMAQPRTPTASAPAFLDRFRKEAEQKAYQCENCANIFLPDANFCRKCGKSRFTAKPDLDASMDSSSSTGCSSDTPATEDLGDESFSLPSVGSATHADGNCSPCAWFWKPTGCRSGQDCTFCHLCPEGARKAMKKAKVAMLRQTVPDQQQVQQHEPAYVACDSSPPFVAAMVARESASSLNPVEGEASRPSADVEVGAVAKAVDPVKVSVKNTFIQFEVPSSPKNVSEPPLRSAPGDFFHKFFQTREPHQRAQAFSGTLSTPPMSYATPMPDFAVDSSLSLPQTAVAGNAVASANAAPMTVSPAVDEMEAAVPMNGKQAHALGQCTPCAYFWYKKDGCRKGDECQFCHLCEKGEIKKRKKHRIQHLKAAGAYIPGYAKILKDAHNTSVACGEPYAVCPCS